MYGFELAIGMTAVVVWSVLVFFRGGFWRLSSSPLKPKPCLKGAAPPHVAVVVPARDEADVIGRTIISLLQQNGEAKLHIFLVDDHSTDGTADRAQEAGSAIGQLDRLTISRVEALPPGWSGKLWAVRAGIERACTFSPDYLLLTDADVVHAPDSVTTLISIAEGADPTQARDGCTGHCYDLASFMVKLHCGSFAERLLIPAFVYFFFKLYPPRWISSARHRIAGAAGGCMLVRPEALERAGGIDAIRSEIIDDCALAKRIKSNGGRVWLGLTPTYPLKPEAGLNGPPNILNGTPLAESIRPYESFAAIEQMIARSAFNQLHHSSLMLIGCIIGLALTYLFPVALLFSGRIIPAILGASALTMMVTSYVPMVRFYRLKPLWAFSLPIAAVFYMAATVHSALNYWAGHGGQWKGRAQDQAVEQAVSRSS